MTFTDPQVCAVGLTEAQARERGIAVRASTVGTGDVAGASVLGNGIAGTSQLVVDEDRRVLVGATFTGPGVQELLHSATVAIAGEVPAGAALARGAVVPDAQRGLAAPPRGLRTLTADVGRCRTSRSSTCSSISLRRGCSRRCSLGFAPRLRIPSVVLEIVAGDRASARRCSAGCTVDLPVQILALVGLAFLLFLAGLEIDLARLRGRLLRVALLGLRDDAWSWRSASGSACRGGLGERPLLLAIALSATSLGLVVPVLKDAGQVGEHGRPDARSPRRPSPTSPRSCCCRCSSPRPAAARAPRLVLLGAVRRARRGDWPLVVPRAGRSMRLGEVLVRLQDTTAEIRVRFAVAAAGRVRGAGRAVRAGEHPRRLPRRRRRRPGRPRLRQSHPNFRVKLEAIGYGFLIPVFFVSSGIRLDLHGLLAQPVGAAAGAGVPAGAAASCAACPALLYLPRARRAGRPSPPACCRRRRCRSSSRPRRSAVTGRIDAVTAAALVSAGLLSVLIFPAVVAIPAATRDCRRA